MIPLVPIDAGIPKCKGLSVYIIAASLLLAAVWELLLLCYPKSSSNISNFFLSYEISSSCYQSA